MSSLEDLRLDLANKAETYVTTNLPELWRTVQRYPAVHRSVNAVWLSLSRIRKSLRDCIGRNHAELETSP